jgi:hypothetical protein
MTRDVGDTTTPANHSTLSQSSRTDINCDYLRFLSPLFSVPPWWVVLFRSRRCPLPYPRFHPISPNVTQRHPRFSLGEAQFRPFGGMSLNLTHCHPNILGLAICHLPIAKFSKTLRISALYIHSTVFIVREVRKSLGNLAARRDSGLCGLFDPSLVFSGVESHGAVKKIFLSEPERKRP